MTLRDLGLQVKSFGFEVPEGSGLSLGSCSGNTTNGICRVGSEQCKDLPRTEPKSWVKSRQPEALGMVLVLCRFVAFCARAGWVSRVFEETL